MPHACRAEPSLWTSHRRSACRDGIPLVAPQANGERALEHDGILANRNCCTIPLTRMTRKPLRRRVEKLRAETRKIVEPAERPISATCVRVPVLVSHAEAVWAETEEPPSAEEARNLGRAPGIRLQCIRRDRPLRTVWSSSLPPTTFA